MKMPSKWLKIAADVRKSRIIDFLKNVWTVRHAFMKWYDVDPPMVMSDQMPLHRNESAHTKTLNSKGQTQITFVKENHMLSRERIIVMTLVASSRKIAPPDLILSSRGLECILQLSLHLKWAPKGSYSLEHMQKFVDKVVPEIPVAASSKLRRIHTLGDYSVDLDPTISAKLFKRGYFPIVLGGGTTGDVQVNDTDLHHPS